MRILITILALQLLAVLVSASSPTPHQDILVVPAPGYYGWDLLPVYNFEVKDATTVKHVVHKKHEHPHPHDLHHPFHHFHREHHHHHKPGLFGINDKHAFFLKVEHSYDDSLE